MAAAAEAAHAQSARAMADSANRFLSALSAADRAKAMISFDDPERFDWGFTPRRRRGIPLKELSPEARRLAHELLRSGLSASGYRKATDVIALEGVLREIEGPYRDPDLYFFSIFGTPAPGAPWGWRVEGHHLSLNYTVAGGLAVSHTPSFFGANPATVR
jgi:hypothetical protein